MLGADMLFKSMGIDPDKIKEHVEGFTQFMLKLDAYLQRIEANQHVIMKHLNLDPVMTSVHAEKENPNG